MPGEIDRRTDSDRWRLKSQHRIGQLYRAVLTGTCKLVGYRAIGPVEQQIIVTSVPFLFAPSRRFRSLAPSYYYAVALRDNLLLSSADEKEMCSVCLEVFDQWDQSFTAPCLHVFHSLCMLTWVHISLDFSCPSCRQDMYSPDRQAYYCGKTANLFWSLWGFGFDSDLLRISRTVLNAHTGQKTSAS